jgi:hypothetical protein
VAKCLLVERQAEGLQEGVGEIEGLRRLEGEEGVVEGFDLGICVRLVEDGGWR